MLESDPSPRNAAGGEVMGFTQGEDRKLSDDDLGGMSGAGDGTWVRRRKLFTAYCRRQPFRSDLDQGLTKRR